MQNALVFFNDLEMFIMGITALAARKNLCYTKGGFIFKLT